MNDKSLMEELLLLEKGVCDLYLHGAIESSTTNVHGAFERALDDSLTMQNTIYQKMSEKGWYPATAAPQNQITAVKQKFMSGI